MTRSRFVEIYGREPSVVVALFADFTAFVLGKRVKTDVARTGQPHSRLVVSALSADPRQQ